MVSKKKVSRYSDVKFQKTGALENFGYFIILGKIVSKRKCACPKLEQAHFEIPSSEAELFQETRTSLASLAML